MRVLASRCARQPHSAGLLQQRYDRTQSRHARVGTTRRGEAQRRGAGTILSTALYWLTFATCDFAT